MSSPDQIGDRRFSARRCVALIVTAVAINASGCSASYPTRPDPTLAAVRIHVADVVVWGLPQNGTAPFVAYAIDSDGVYTDVTSRAVWTSSNPGVMSTLPVQSGRVNVRGVSPGDADLTVTYSGHTDAVTLRVPQPTLSIPRLEMSSAGGSAGLVINRNGAASLRVSVIHRTSSGFQNVTSSASISTSDSNIAIADGATIRPVSPGTFRILASYDGLTSVALASVSPSAQAAQP